MGAIQNAFNKILGSATALAIAGRKASDIKGQAREDASAKAKAEAESKKNLQEEAKNTAIEADLIRMGADPETARSFMDARNLGLATKGFGAIKQKGRYVGTYSTIAEQLAKDSLADSLTSKVINQKGFAEKVMKLREDRKGRVEALANASKGGKK